MRRFAKVSEEEIVAINEAAIFYPSDLVNTKTAIPLRVREARWIYTSTLRVSVYIHHYSPHLRGIVVYYFNKRQEVFPDPSPQRDKKCDAKLSLRKETNQKANLRLDIKEHLVTL